MAPSAQWAIIPPAPGWGIPLEQLPLAGQILTMHCISRQAFMLSQQPVQASLPDSPPAPARIGIVSKTLGEIRLPSTSFSSTIRRTARYHRKQPKGSAEVEDEL